MKNKVETYDITKLEDLELLAKKLSDIVKIGNFIYLEGDLGTGKTAFAKLFIKHKGYNGLVTSPTYSLMNEYNVKSESKIKTETLIHCDLYRLADPEELYEIGLLDIAAQNNSIVLVEWAEKGKGILPKADIIIKLELSKYKRTANICWNINNKIK